MSPNRASARTPRLAFDDLGLEIVLAGFSDPMATRLAYAFQCRLSSKVTGFDRFRFQLATDSSLSYTEAEIRGALLDGHLQHHSTDDGDRLELPGAQVLIWPDRDAADITVHPDLLLPGAPRDNLIQLAAEGALHRALLQCGAFLLHAAAFELEGLAILAIGPSGAGKSTLSAVALAAGGRVVSDDALIVFTDAAGEITVRPSRPDMLFRKPTPEFLTPTQQRSLDDVNVGGSEKWRLTRDDHESQFLPSLHPQVICLLHHQRSTALVDVRPADQAKLVAALLATSFAPYLARPGYEPDLRRLVDLARQLASTGRILDLFVRTLWPGSSPNIAIELVSELISQSGLG